MPRTPAPPSTTRTLADRLALARDARFVGRTDELSAFTDMLDGRDPRAVLLLHGPGGIGKSALLTQMARLAEQRGRSVMRLDARDIEPSTAGVWKALRRAAGDGAEWPGEAGAPDAAPLAAPAWPDAPVLMIDTLEQIGALERWLLETCLPALPADALVVLAGRQRPGTDWQLDAGWSALAQVRALPMLAEAEARQFLGARGVPAARQVEAMALARGHPLALTLLADALAAGRDEVLASPAERRALLRALAVRVAADAPTPAHRRALRVLLMAHATTEAMLDEVVDGAEGADVPALYEFLRALPFVEEGDHGLVPHDLVREAMQAEWAARADPAFEPLRVALMQHLTRRLQRQGRGEALRLLVEWTYLVRDTPVGHFLDPALLDAHHADAARPDDAPALLTLARHSLGPQAAGLMQHWLQRQPEGVRVVRDRAGRVAGGWVYVDLRRVDARDRAADPGVDWAAARLDALPPLADGEHAWAAHLMVRAGERDHPSPAFQFMSLETTARWLQDRQLAWSCTICPEPERLQPLFDSFTRFHWHRREGPGYELDGRRWGAFERHWRAEPNPLWPSRDPAAPRARLDRDAFARAVREAVKQCPRDEALRASPLMEADLMRGHPDDPQALRTALHEAVAELARHPRDHKFHHALRLTWLDPGGSQETVAAELGLPFNTYRYHLARGLERVVETLWQRELRAAPAPDAAA